MTVRISVFKMFPKNLGGDVAWNCTCRDTTGTVIQSFAVFGDKTTCMICRREITKEEQEEAFRRSYERAWEAHRGKHP